MLSRVISTLVAFVFVVQPLAAVFCAADCENSGSSQTPPLRVEHCANAAAQRPEPTAPHHPSTERPTPSSQDGSDCEHGHRVCAAVDDSRAELYSPPLPMMGLEPQPRYVPLPPQAPLVRHGVVPQAGPPDSAPRILALRI